MEQFPEISSASFQIEVPAEKYLKTRKAISTAKANIGNFTGLN
jgi:hypothetical protein